MTGFVDSAGEVIKRAVDRNAGIRIAGGGSKAFYGRAARGDEELSTLGHRGIVDYEPSELVVTARAGTPLAELEDHLRQHDQVLPFEPPRFGDAATIGGAIATGLSGPRRPHAGAARDALLGCEIINGFGEHLAFGGQVMKNVAGYDISRLMAGALGTLGVITQVSLRLIPRPVAERTLAFEMDAATAIARMNAWAGRPLPLTASCHDGDRLYIRLAGSASGVDSAAAKLGGEALPDGPDFWSGLREQMWPFYRDAASLWRLSVSPATPPLDLPGRTVLEWLGGLRWLVSDAAPHRIRGAAAAAGGHATWFRGHDGDDVFHPLDDGRQKLHRNLKRAFDPVGVLNPGRMYADAV